MIVLDANILIRAVLGRRVRQLFENYSGHGLRFYATEIAYGDALKYLPSSLRAKGIPETDVPAALEYLQSFVEPVHWDLYGLFEEEAKQCLRGRDEEYWPVLAAAMALSCAIWTEDRDFFGSGIAVWTSDRVQILLKEKVKSLQTNQGRVMTSRFHEPDRATMACYDSKQS